MASRKEEKERLRKEREERERKEQEKSQKRRRRLWILGIAAGVVLIAVVAFAVLHKSKGQKSSQEQATSQGLQITPGPWEPATEGLEDRTNALQLPPPSDTIYHVHAQLRVYVNGKQFKVPANVGIDQGKQYLASLHTHDDTGIIHMEAVEPYPFTLGQFFTIWGVKFTENQLGSYRGGNGLVLETYVNGEKVPNGPRYQIKPHDAIVVGFGKPGSFPKTFKPTFSPGE